ncbi:MAG TPA: hypothetical protein VID05_10470, partial [Acidimicrobiales bacterium]
MVDPEGNVMQLREAVAPSGRRDPGTPMPKRTGSARLWSWSPIEQMIRGRLSASSSSTVTMARSVAAS